MKSIQIPPSARGVSSLIVLALNTVFWCCLLFPLALLKLISPGLLRRRIDPLLNGLAVAWVSVNNVWFGWVQQRVWAIEGIDGLSPVDWYLVNCNHQSWVDIFVLQRALGGRIPLLKFFLKRELIYVPLIGLAWWALDFPFMKRQGKTQLRRRVDSRRQDQDAARKACEKFSQVPTSVMVFSEGTRFTQEKHASQGSPYRNLLKPRAGGLAVTLNTMGAKFRSVLDVTIVYSDGAPSFWQFACGQTGTVQIRVREVPVPANFCTSDYGTDASFRREFHRWLARQWEEKDLLISQLTGVSNIGEIDGTSGPGPKASAS